MRLLIWGEQLYGGPYDVFRQLDYNCVYSELVNNYHANVTNIGNKVWIQGIISCLSTEDNQLFFLNPDETWAQINEKYDAIIYSAANLLSVIYRDILIDISKIFKNSKIPVYVISVGAQADSYSDLDLLINQIKNETSDFIETIYSTGGEIACRGYFTKMVLDKIAYNTASVIGCPSLFQNGCNLHIEKKQEIIHPVFNGLLLNDKTLFDEYSNSVFIDQDQWLQESYDVSFYNDSYSKILRKLIEKKGTFETELFLANRIRLFYDVPHWRAFLQQEGFNFSCGTRIHGNIISLLSGVPALVLACDSRTQEMAEYYDIPWMRYSKKHLDISKLFQDTDYSSFNRNFIKKYEKFEAFLVSHNLVKKMNQNNKFWDKASPIPINTIERKKHHVAKLYKHINSFGKVGRKVFYKVTNKYLEDIDYNYIFTVEQYDKRTYNE